MIMEDPVFKEKYQKYKYRVKVWEKEFLKKQGRIPSKYDIREAPTEIRYSYKMYYKMKTTFLEDTLSDVLSEDGFDILDTSQGEITLNFSFPSGISNLVDNDVVNTPETQTFSNIEQIKTNEVSVTNFVNVNENHIIKEFEPVERIKLNEKAWNESVSNKEQKKKKAIVQSSVKLNLSQKLFTSSTFVKRNPRKSLSRLSSGSISKNLSSNSTDVFLNNDIEILPDLETILSQKSQQQQQQQSQQKSNDDILLKLKLQKQISTDVDKRWLDRCTAENENSYQVSFPIESSISNNAQHSQPKKFGISNLNVDKINYINTVTTDETAADSVAQNIFINNPKNADDSDSVVENSEDETITASQSYRHVAKKRRILKNIDKNQEPLREEKKKEPEICLKSKPQEEKIKLVVDSKDVEANQDTSKESIYDFTDNDCSDDNKKAKKGKKKSQPKRKKQTKKLKHDEEAKASRRKSYREKKDISYCETNSENENDDKIERRNAPESVNKEPVKQKRNTRKETRKNSKKSKKTTQSNSDRDENIDNETHEQKYVVGLEFGKIKSLPRINIDELAQTENVLNSFINTTVPNPSAKQNIPKSNINIKEENAKRKLEKKIASGKINENFVRIDIQKKVFVRGKKKINFGKYKKNLWKQKKAAALAGPDMDMGGCDGGILTCFKCNQPGHMARQCKIKGDALLPFDAKIEDESPFPTLEEAENMAMQQALPVHSRNIEKLPAASNQLIYKSDDGSDSNTENENIVDNIDDSENHSTQSDKDPTQNIPPPPQAQSKTYVGHKIPDDFLEKAGLADQTSNSEVRSLYQPNSDGTTINVTQEVVEALRMFGHTNFRKGQDKAIMRILSGMSTLVTLSTGSGKSLCYQLPAYLYSKKMKCITLVISPLVSLMEDQVHGVPMFLNAQCLHTNQTPQQKQNVLEMINKGEVDILLVSPEAVLAGEKSTGFGALLRNLPPIAFACIDEAHCVSQWSHNFRPSYLMICKVLKKKLGINTVLGLTATATLPTRESIIRHLAIPDGVNGIISDIPLPDNLILSVSKDVNRDAALMEILRSERFDCCQSIIIYCTRRDECERIAGLIRTCMQDREVENKGGKKRKRVNWNAEPYHAGMVASRRRTIQNAFMKNELRIVVATIAFGMGINKPDIRAIIHYNMPRNFESYVQEVGRAGRDGKIAHCHLFLDSKNTDQSELRRHIYANSIDRHVIRKLLQKVFNPCACEKNFKKSDFVNDYCEEIEASQNINWDEDFHVDSSSHEPRKRVCPGHEIGFSILKTVEALDIPEENISTLLCYLELDGRWRVNVLGNAYTMAKVISYGGSKGLKQAAKNCPPLAIAIAMELKKGTFDEQNNIFEFSVIDIASAIGWNSGVIKYQLKELEWTTVNGLPKRSSISVSFYDLGFRVTAPGDFTDDELDEALDILYNRSVQQEKTQLIQLQYVFQGLSSVAFKSCSPCCSNDYTTERSDSLKSIIREYFLNDYPQNMVLEEIVDTVPDDLIKNDVCSMIYMYPENNFTGRTLARIFHGIQSPNFPAVIWGRCKYWRAHAKADFNRIVRLANEVIVKMRT